MKMNFHDQTCELLVEANEDLEAEGWIFGSQFILNTNPVIDFE